MSETFNEHDHTSCIATALKQVEAYCAETGQRLTQSRRRVLEILLQDHKAMGAYEILEVLRSDGMAAQPPVAYRALEFLSAHGFVHKIERLNAYVACAHPGDTHRPAFMICRKCTGVVEVAQDDAAELSVPAQTAGFQIERTVVEAEGICPNCTADPI